MCAAEYHDGWTELAAAIVGQACKDYTRALIRRHRHPEMSKHTKDVRECEGFFRSSWCEVLCDVDGEMLITKLRHMAADTVRKKEAV